MADPLTNYPLLQHILPDAYEYRICNFKDCTDTGVRVTKEEDSQAITKFLATIRLKLRTKSEACTWIKDMERISAVTWRVDKTYPVCGGRKTQNIYRIDLRCQHQTYSRSPTANKKPSSKNTACPAKMFLVVKRTHMASGKISQSTDEYLQEFPTRVYLDFRHNHNLLSPECLAKRDVSEETVRKLRELYVAGHTPLSALEELKRDLQADYGDQYGFVLTDRSKCPDKQFCYRLYYKLFYPKYPKPPGKKRLLDLQKYLTPFCEKYNSHCASIEQTANDDVIIAICTVSGKNVQNENSGDQSKTVPSEPLTPQQSLSSDNYTSHLHFLEPLPDVNHEDVSQSQGIRECQEGLRMVLDDLTDKLESSPDNFVRPIQEFLKHYREFKKDQELITSLESFGQHTGVIGAINRTLKRKHSETMPEKTAIICTKRKRGSRRQMISSRPIVQQDSPPTSHHPNTPTTPTTPPDTDTLHVSTFTHEPEPLQTSTTQHSPTIPTATIHSPANSHIITLHPASALSPSPNLHTRAPFHTSPCPDHHVPENHIQATELHAHQAFTHKIHTINIEGSEVETVALTTEQFEIHEAPITTTVIESGMENSISIIHEVSQSDIPVTVVEEVSEQTSHHQHNHHNQHHHIQLHQPHLPICTIEERRS